MPLVVTSVPNLAQGVSQQPDNLRYPGQCDEQVNAWATVVEGLVKRPNTRWVREFNSGGIPAGSSDLFTHFVKRDEDNKYCVQVSLGGVGVIDLDNGINIPVAVTSIANTYLGLGSSITNPLKDIRALTVADYTFLVNKKRTVAKKSTLSPTPKKQALVVVKLGDYQKNYSIYINNQIVPLASTIDSKHDYLTASNQGANGALPATYISGTSDTNPKLLHADTEYIARDLYDCLEEAYGTTGVNGITGVNITNGGSGWLVFPPQRGVTDTKKLTFTISQTVGGVTNSTAKGTATVENGVITALNFTNRGQGYNTNQVTNPLTFNFDSYWFNWLQWNLYTYSSPPTSPTITATIGTLDVYNIERQGSVIRISSRDEEAAEEDFDIRVEDGLANQGLGLVYKEIDSITELPKSCFNKHVVKVLGDADIDQDDYYVKFKTKDGTDFGEGTWIEVVGWKSDGSEADIHTGVETELDAETMPITLVPVLNSSGNVSSFKLQSPEEGNIVEAPNEVGWRTRQAGDDDTNPFPSFVGKTINDVFFFKNRLGFLTDSAVIFSEADEYFNFFRTTTQQLLDSAPIDVGLSHTKVAVLQHALPFQEKLMLFSDNSQFVLRGADILSPKTVAISPVTEYDISDGIAPLALGPYIYFPFNRGRFEGMFEYFVDNNTEVFEAEEITSQVPKYIPTSIKRMAGSASESMLVLQSANDPKTLFVYKYFWSGKEKIQSAWQRWSFDDAITGFDFIDSTLYLILNGIQLVEMPVENDLTDTGLDYALLLDNRIDGAVATVNYDNQTNRTTISNLPSGYDATTDFTVFTKGGSERKIVDVSFGDIEIEGFLASYVKYEGVIYKCGTNHTSSLFTRPDTSPFWSVSTEVPNAPAWTSEGAFYNNEQYFVVGKPYNMLYRFSNQALKQPTERGGRSASDYTYQTIRNASIEYADSGHFTVEVTPRFRDKYTYVYNPALLSSISTLDRFTPESGHFRFAVQCRPEEATIEVQSSSALPVKLLAAEFESMVTGRSKRYGA